MKEQVKTENKMGTEPIPKVMLSMGIPMIISMVLQACYNIVDSMFVARMPDQEGLLHTGEYAVNALTLAFPVQMLIVAFGIGTGVGVNALLSKSLGQNDKKKVARAAGNGVILGIIIYLCFFLFGLFGIDIYLKSQTKDPVILSMVTAMAFHYRKNTEVESKWSYLKPDLHIIKEIYVIGLPAIIMQALMSFMTYGVNIIFGAVSTAAVTAYGIFYKIQQFLFFAGFGLRDAITPIVSFNYGMGNAKRVKEGIRYGVLYVSIIMAVGIVGLELFAAPLVQIFGLSEKTAELCVLAICIISAGFLFAGGNIAIQGVFQALGCGLSSLAVSLLRLLVVVLPLAWWFSTFANAEFIIWFAFPIAEAVAFLVTVLLIIRADRKVIRVIESRETKYNKGLISNLARELQPLCKEF